MCALNIEQLAAAVSEDAPCGENLEDSSEFRQIEMELDRVVQGDRTGALTDAADWQEIRRHSQELLQRTKDLRLCVFLAASSLRQPEGGLSEFKDALSLVRTLVEERWETVHPQPDSGNKADPYWGRTQAIGELGTPIGARGDAYEILKQLRALPLTRQGQEPQFCRRDIMILRGELAVDEQEKNRLNQEKKDEATLESAFGQTVSLAREFLDSLAGDARQAAAHVEAISKQFREKAERTAPDLELLRLELLAIAKEVENRLGYQASVSDDPDPSVSEGPSNESLPADVVRDTTKPPPASLGKVSSRAEVLQAIDRIQDYYRQYEPSSPVPFLLQRARRFVNMNFVDIVQDIAADAVANMKVIIGPESSEK